MIMENDIGKKLGGVLVQNIFANSPAQKAGVQVGDIILSMNDIPTPDYTKYIEAYDTRDTNGHHLEILRGSQIIKVFVDTSKVSKETMTTNDYHNLMHQLDPNKKFDN